MKDIYTFIKAYARTRFWNHFSSRKQLEHWQDCKVRKHLHKILPISSFYREHYEGLLIEEWKNFPIIDKTMMMENFDRLNTAQINKVEAFSLTSNAEQTRQFTKDLNGITLGTSSGTSGNRGIFAVDKRERSEWAGTFLAKILPGSILHSHRLALFLRSNSNLYTSTRRKKIQFEYFDLLHPIQEHIDRLNHYHPTVVLAPPSMLRFLAHAKEENKLKINPQKIVSIAEVLDPLDEEYIGSCFSQSIHQVYQCTEGFLGTTCPYGKLHINEDLVVVQKEYLDETKCRFIPIITDFHRTIQPIIRYRLNDILTESKQPCPCGSVFMALDRIEGRCDDIFYLTKLNSTELIPIFPDFIRQAILTGSSEIREYLAVQKSPVLLQLSLRVPAASLTNTTNQIQENLNKMCVRLNCQPMQIQFIETFPAYDGKKLRRVQRDYVL